MTEPSQYFKGRTVQEQMNEVIGYVDTRAAEVATEAIASDVAQVHQDMLDADADAQAAAASAAAAAGTLANAVKKTGEASQSIAGDIAVAGNLSGGTVTVPTPVNNTDAASKKYVDDVDTLKADKTYVDAQDALKADKTYVDAQDALKLNITDVTQYALGLTDNQVYSGTKETGTLQIANSRPYLFQRVAAESKWFKVFEFNANRRIMTMDVTWAHQSYNGGGSGRILIGVSQSSSIFAKWLYRYSVVSNFTADTVFIGVTPDGTTEIWVKGGFYVYCEIVRIFRGNVEETISNISNVYDGVGVSDIDLTAYSYYAYGSE